MDRRTSKSLLRDFAVPMQDNTAYSLSYGKDSSKDPRKATNKAAKPSKGKSHGFNKMYQDTTGLLKMKGAAPLKAKGGKVGNPEHRDKPGGSNVGKYSKSEGPFAGPSGGAPVGSFPIGSKQRGKSALKLAHNAPNPSGIKSAVYRRYPDLKHDKKAMEGAKLSINGMGRMQDKAPQPTKYTAQPDKIKKSFALYKKKEKAPKSAFAH